MLSTRVRVPVGAAICGTRHIFLRNIAETARSWVRISVTLHPEPHSFGSKDASPYTSLYFILFLVLASFFVMNVFIA